MNERKEHAMSEVLTAREELLADEAPAIQETRELMKAARARIWPLAYQGDDATRSASLGRLAHALEAADTALFEVLCEAASYGGCAASRRTIDASYERDEPTTESAES